MAESTGWETDDEPGPAELGSSRPASATSTQPSTSTEPSAGPSLHTDLAGVHLAILPGSGGRAHAGKNPNIAALEIDGIRAY